MSILYFTSHPDISLDEVLAAGLLSEAELAAVLEFETNFLALVIQVIS